MKHLYLITLVLATTFLVGCDEIGHSGNPVQTEEERSAALSAASARILGEWRLVNASEESTLIASLTFSADGQVVYEGNITSADQVSHIESAYSFENDWLEEDESLTGHVFFVLWGELEKYGGKSRIGCVLSDSELRIWNANYPDAVQVAAPHVYRFVRIE